MDEGYELERAFQRKNSPSFTVFDDLWPSETRGNGSIKENNKKNGGAQGKASFLLKASCRLCGFINDLSKIDHSGGSLDGNGACYVARTGTASAPVSGGGTHTEAYGDPGTRAGAGCALCGSKNSTKQRVLQATANPWNAPQPLGF
jgi:hypothetical protein